MRPISVHLDEINRYMVQAALSALREADLVLFLVEPSRQVGPGDQLILRYVKEVETPVFLLVNKIDLVASKERLIDFYKYWTMIESAMKADGRGMNIPVKNVRLGKDTALISGKIWYLHEIKADRSVVCHCAAENRLKQIVVKQKFFH